ncbi:extracellular solute-binding protein [Candidatus Epulonipiscium viviparus]|uniref:extracellular solute-binding protein n=1 Tax=Candidatus Epulonipiscium viviparus TaxID=420336 RepID=UPI00016C0B27|nr:extracellular solute-binding protein [Candidatus Epulopiscium viviparus]
MKKNLFLLGLIGMTLLVGCGSDDSSSTELTAPEYAVSADIPGWTFNNEPTELDWYVNFSWFTTPWGEDMTSQKITEETGVTVNFVVPAGNEAEKLNTMIASDTLPDIITLGWWEGQIPEIIDAEMVYALDELAQMYDPYFFEVTNDSRVGWYTSADGHLYQYPNSSYTPEDYEMYDNIAANPIFAVRKDMYEALGSPDMSTPEGFLDALSAAQEMFPEVNGQPLIPFGANGFSSVGNTSLDVWLQDFLAIPFEKDGKLYDRTTDPEYIIWLKTLNQAWRDGLIANDVFIDGRPQMEEKQAQGRYFSMLYQRTDFAAQQQILFANDPDTVYLAIDGPKNSAGDDHVLPGVGIQGWTVTLISKNCEEPDRAIQFLSYMMSEHGQKLIKLGIEGEMYDVVDGEHITKPEVTELLMSDRVSYDRKYGAEDTFWMLQDLPMQLQWSAPTQEPLAQLEEWAYPYTVFASQYGGLTAPIGSEEEKIALKVGTLWGETLPALIRAADEATFDQIFADFVAERDALGFDQLVALQQEIVDTNKAKLGLK